MLFGRQPQVCFQLSWPLVEPQTLLFKKQAVCRQTTSTSKTALVFSSGALERGWECAFLTLQILK